MTELDARIDRKDYQAASGHLVLKQKHMGWPGSGWRSQDVELAVRRVLRNGLVDEVQVNVEIRSHHDKRTVTTSGTMTLSPDLAAELVKALTTIWERPANV